MLIKNVETGTLDLAADMFKALGNGHRLALLWHLSHEGPANVTELKDALGLGQSLVSQHLRVLRQVRLVSSARRGQEVVYSIRDAHVAHIVADAVGHMREDGAG